MPRSMSRVLLATLVATAACSPDQPILTSPMRADALVASSADKTPAAVSLELLASFGPGVETASEIPAFDFVSKRLFVVNGALGSVDVYDVTDPGAPVQVGSLAFGGAANSVAADRGVVAIAVQAADKTQPGTVELYRATTLEPITSVTVGALPDMLAFSPSGRYLVVANEGEPNDAYTVDPEGSVSIIDVRNVNRPVVRTAGFAAFNGQAAQLRAQGVRIFGPGATVAQDLEPEYVTVSADERTAWVTLQENNALAVVDLEAATVRAIAPLGYKDHSIALNALDASDRDNTINIRSWPVFGMYQPDAIASYVAGGQTFLVTANEGDARDYAGFAEEARVNTLTLEPTVFTDALCGGPCAANSRLGRLNVTRTLGLNASTGRYERLYAFGARSLTIWTADGQVVWDSGDQLEQLTRSLGYANFNASNNDNTFDSRSDNKGPEPEGLVVATFGARTFALLGLERIGGVAVYDITNPHAPFLVTYANTRSGTDGDRGPEGITFVPANRSPNKEPLVIVGNETSGTTTIFQVRLH